jgi:hypothetical protein
MPEFEAISAGNNGMFFEENNAESLAKILQDWFAQYPIKSNSIINNCIQVIDQLYNPNYQLQVISKVLLGN